MSETSHFSNTLIRIAEFQMMFFREELKQAEQDLKRGKLTEDECSLLSRLLQNDLSHVELRLRLFQRSSGG
ncbi:hypothetical protein [Rufibacter roseus]|uniref:Uncharacterized protein n=1 Tax=Rufibacter roseus TaxID=1567108 RepID=A0ABW2DPH8_9BACT|nr:hypothetical protein [Rufibacter roseus]